MKKLIVVLAVLVFLVMNAGYCFADLFSKEKPAETKTITKQVAVNADSKDAVAKKKSELIGTQWAIEMKAMTGKAKAEKDTLTFTENKVSSKNLMSRGYPSTNFSMRLLDDNETFAWETMQVSEKEGTAFWRGDIGPDGVMRGVLSIRDKKEHVTDYNFHSKESIRIAVPEPAPAAEPAPAQ